MRESELWRRVVDSADERALGELYDLHVDRAYRHALRLAADRRDAEDAVAVALLELWRRRAAVRLVDGSPLPWLLATTTNALRNLQRSAARYRKLLETIPRAEHAASAEDDAFADDGVRSALATLGQIDRQLVALVLLEGFSGDEAAVALGLSPGAARTRLSRARTKLRSSLRGPSNLQEETA